MISTITRTLAFTPTRMPAIRPRLKVSLTAPSSRRRPGRRLR
jgi:hypothetical protein